MNEIAPSALLPRNDGILGNSRIPKVYSAAAISSIGFLHLSSLLARFSELFSCILHAEHSALTTFAPALLSVFALLSPAALARW